VQNTYSQSNGENVRRCPQHHSLGIHGIHYGLHQNGQPLLSLVLNDLQLTCHGRPPCATIVALWACSSQLLWLPSVSYGLNVWHFHDWPCRSPVPTIPAGVEIGEGRGSGEAASQRADAAFLTRAGRKEIGLIRFRRLARGLQQGSSPRSQRLQGGWRPGEPSEPSSAVTMDESGPTVQQLDETVLPRLRANNSPWYPSMASRVLYGMIEEREVELTEA
jgi:hypothetical protein